LVRCVTCSGLIHSRSLEVKRLRSILHTTVSEVAHIFTGELSNALSISHFSFCKRICKRCFLLFFYFFLFSIFIVSKIHQIFPNYSESFGEHCTFSTFMKFLPYESWGYNLSNLKSFNITNIATMFQNFDCI